MSADFLEIAPLILLALGGVTVFCLGAFGHAGVGSLWITALAIAVAAGLAELWAAGSGGLSGIMDPGGYGRFFSLLLVSITIVAMLFLHRYAGVRKFAGDELYGIMLFATMGAILAAGTENWVVFFLGFELLSLSLYILIAMQRGEPTAGEAGLKYFIMGAVAGGFVAFGLALLYAVTGTPAISHGLSRIGPDDLPLALLSFGFILTGLGFKLSIVPFHLWTPDVYQGAPAPVTAFLSTASKVAVFAALTRIMLATPAIVWDVLGPVLWVLSALTMTVGNIAAIRQAGLKRRLAYSSIAQMGYLLMALLVVRGEGLPAIMFYLAVYAVMDLGAFGLLGSFSPEGKDRDGLADYRGLGYSRPWRSGVMSLCLLSLAGLPPTAGFIGKFLIFKSTLAAGYLALSIIGVCTVVVGLYYYMEVVVQLYMHPRAEPTPVAAAGFSDTAAWAIVAVLVLLLGIVPSPLLSCINSIASSFPGLVGAVH